MLFQWGALQFDITPFNVHEADQIVSLFTRDQGKLKGIAKSAAKSRAVSPTNPPTLVYPQRVFCRDYWVYLEIPCSPRTKNSPPTD